MKDIVKGNFKLKKVKKEKKEVIASDSNDLMTQLNNTLERRRTAIAGEKQNNKFKKAACIDEIKSMFSINNGLSCENYDGSELVTLVGIEAM